MIWPLTAASRLRRARRNLPARPTPTGPLDYLAFRQLHHDPYLKYASHRLTSRDAAQQAVDAAFSELAAQWLTALRSPSPAAVAWSLLQHAVANAPSRTDTPPHALPSQQSDAVLLHRRLGLTVEEAAALMGIDRAALITHLALARRALT